MNLLEFKTASFTRFHPGAGAGGHCVPVDPVYLVDHLATLGSEVPLVRAALAANAERPRAVAREIAARMPGGRPGRALLVGVTWERPVLDACGALSRSGWPQVVRV